jgi:hypothetical protein
VKIAEAGSAAVAQGSSAANEGLRTVNLISLHPQSDWAIAKDYILSAAAENVRNSLSAPNAEGCNPAESEGHRDRSDRGSASLP